MKKRILSLSLIFFLILSNFANIVQANINVIEQTSSRRILAGGLISHEYNFRTSAGWIRANVIEADMTNPNLEFRPIWSTSGMQQLATTQNIVTQNGAIAGVNADFFAWASNVAPGRGSPIGGVVRDGELITSGTHETGAAAFFQYTDGTFGADYLGATISMKHTSNETNEVTVDTVIGGMNKFSDLSRPFIYTSDWGTHFRSVYAGMRKVVVEDSRTGIVTAITDETGDLPIPQNGFILVFLLDQFQEGSTWVVGDRVEIATLVTPNISNIEAAIGGGTQLLNNGAFTTIAHGPTGRNPRSAVGTDANGTTLYLVTVDGRQSHSIGATLPELAGIMQIIGAHTAVNLDGGGSTALVAQGRDGTTSTINHPSENRAVSNVIGIMSRGLVGNELDKIEIELASNRIRLGEQVNATVVGLDRYGNEWPLDSNMITITGLAPLSVGTSNVRATYGDYFSAEAQITVLEPFTDVPASHWASEAITFAFQNGIMGSIETGGRVFEPSTTLSRAMVATILYRLEGSPNVSGAPAFTDVEAQKWYSDAIVWAHSNGIVTGMGDGLFMPSASVTREQFAAMMHRYANFRGDDTSVPSNFTLSNYEDAASVSSWAQNDIRWANHRGLITGLTATTLVPQGSANRAQCATILHRFMTEL